MRRTRSSKGSFEGNRVFLDAFEGIRRNGRDTVDERRRNIDFLPHDRYFGGTENSFDRFTDLGSNSCEQRTCQFW